VEVTAVILLLGLNSATQAYCSQGEEAFQRGDYLQASEYYRGQLEKSPNDPQLLYNFGTSSYKNNMYDDAIEAFSKALKGDDIALQEKAYYNRGNSYYQKGVEAQQADPQATIGYWQQALSSLQSALELNPDDQDAGHNHDIIKKRLEELKKQQQNQENKQDQQQNSDGKDQKQDNSSQQNKDQQQSNPEKQQAESGQSAEQSDKKPKDQERDQKQPAASEKNDAALNQPTPQNEASTKNKNPEEQAKKDALRQQLGKMTKEEAEKMLNALKNEEGELNFVPSGGNNQNDVEKDW
jgi:Ca-activated chloride channel homolog